MPRRQWLLTCARLPAMVLIVVGAGCSSSAPVPGSPHASTPSTPVVYTLAESGHPTTCTEIGHGKPVDIDWDPASSSFFVATYNDGTIYRGRLDDPTVPVYIEGTLGQVADGIAVARSLLYIAGGFSGQIMPANVAVGEEATVSVSGAMTIERSEMSLKYSVAAGRNTTPT